MTATEQQRAGAPPGPPPPARQADRVSQLYRDHGRALLGYAVRRCASREDAYDLVAEVFLVACRRPEAVPVPDDRHRPWLFGVARLVLANQLRSGSRASRLGQKLAEHLDVALVPDPAALLETHEDVRTVRRALADLSDDDRELLCLVAWEGFTPAQAAAALGITDGAARVRLHRARARVRRSLDRLDARTGVLAGEAR